MIRWMTKADVDGVVEIHTNYISDSFLATLGSEFVKIIYQTMLLSKYGINYIYEESSIIIGFISGSIDVVRLFNDILVRSGYPLVMVGLFNMIKKPEILRELWKTPLYFKKTNITSVKAELLFIAVRPDYREKGIAMRLIEAVLEDLRNRGISKVKVTVIERNIIVNQLLRKYGFNFENSFDFYGKKMNLYSYNL